MFKWSKEKTIVGIGQVSYYVGNCFPGLFEPFMLAISFFFFFFFLNPHQGYFFH